MEIKETSTNEFDINAIVKLKDHNGLFDKTIELGSYGIRSNDFIEYIYGTGLAEPRLTKTLNLLNINGIS